MTFTRSTGGPSTAPRRRTRRARRSTGSSATCATWRARRSRSRRPSTRRAHYDLVFQTVDSVGPNTGANAANIKRVRWCLDQSTPANEKLYIQDQKWTTHATARGAVDELRAPARAGRPQPSWRRTSRTPTGARSRPLFTLQLGDADRDHAVHVDLYSDLDPDPAPERDAPHVGRVPAQPEPGAGRVVHQGAQRVRRRSCSTARQSYDPEGESLQLQLVGQRRRRSQRRRHRLHLSGHAPTATTRCSCRSSTRPASRASPRPRAVTVPEDDHERTLADEQGWALVTAILLMAIMLGTILGVAHLRRQPDEARRDTRKRETAFNMSEAALNVQIFALSQRLAGRGRSDAHAVIRSARRRRPARAARTRPRSRT